jgi:hypothetical protein
VIDLSRLATGGISAIGVITDIAEATSGVRPWGWTVSCGGFDGLPSVVVLELCRA